MTLPKVSVPGPKFTSEPLMTVSVPLAVSPALALTPVVPPMLEVPIDVKRPSSAKLPALLKVAPFRVRALRNTELAATVSEAAEVALERTKLLAAVKLWTDCTLLDRVTVEPANGVSMHTSSVTRGTLAGFQFVGVVHWLSGGTAPPVHRIVATPLHAVALVTVIVAEALAFAGVEFVSFSVTVAVFVIDPRAVAVAVRETEAVAPFAKVPRLHATIVGLGTQVPWLGVAETNVRPAGSTSVTVTPVELDGPLLVTAIAKVTVVP